MKKLIGLVVVLAVVALAGAALAQQPGWGPRMGMGWGGPGWGGMMGARGYGGGGPGFAGCPMAGFTAGDASVTGSSTPVTEEKANEIAAEYVKKYMKGYTIERVLPFAGRWHTAYQVELKGPKGESRVLHVNPWGAVRPFGGPLAASE